MFVLALVAVALVLCYYSVLSNLYALVALLVQSVLLLPLLITFVCLQLYSSTQLTNNLDLNFAS